MASGIVSTNSSDMGSFLIMGNGDVFISMAYTDRIPTDTPVRSRFFSEPLSFYNQADGTPGCVFISQGKSLFFSLKYLNQLLATCKHESGGSSAVGLCVDLTLVGLKLSDAKGRAIELKFVTEEHHLQDSAGQQDANSLRDGQVVNPAAEQQETIRTEGGEQSSRGVQKHQEEGHQDQDTGTQGTRSLERTESQQQQSEGPAASLREPPMQHARRPKKRQDGTKKDDSKKDGSNKGTANLETKSAKKIRTNVQSLALDAGSSKTPPNQQASVGDHTPLAASKNASGDDMTVRNGPSGQIQAAETSQDLPSLQLEHVDTWTPGCQITPLHPLNPIVAVEVDDN